MVMEGRMKLGDMEARIFCMEEKATTLFMDDFLRPQNI